MLTCSSPHAGWQRQGGKGSAGSSCCCISSTSTSKAVVRQRRTNIDSKRGHTASICPQHQQQQQQQQLLRQVQLCRGSQPASELHLPQPVPAVQQRIAAADRRRAQLADALQTGLRVVIDCSYAQAAQEWVEQQQRRRQQPQQQIWGHAQQPDKQSQQQSQKQQEQHQQLTELQKVGQAADGSFKQHSASSSSSSSNSDSNGVTSSINTAAEQDPPTRGLVTGTFIHKEVRSVAKQIELAAAINKRSPQPVALTVTSFTGALAAFANHMGAAAWPINKHPESLLELYSPDSIVLMSPDAQEPLMTVDSSKVYVIGGIVDKTVQKGLTMEFAEQHNLPAYRLPVKEYAQQLGMHFAGANTRPILTAADVVTALVEYNRTGDWGVALQAAVPSRKRRQPAHD